MLRTVSGIYISACWWGGGRCHCVCNHSPPRVFLRIKPVWCFLSQVFCSTQNIDNDIHKKWVLLAAVARQVDVQWSQIGGIMVDMPHNRGFFSAITKLRGDSSYRKCHGIRFPCPCSRAEHNAQIWQHTEVSGVRPSERNRKLQDAHIKREPFSRTRVTLGVHSGGHFGGEFEDRLPRQTKTWILKCELLRYCW